MSALHGVPLSTLKLNARILREMQLISHNARSASLTVSGREIVALLRNYARQALPVQEVKR
ncbi:MAG TPA: hypothetical protein VJR06_05780 [Nitrososphaerales archaeon]|nr:hypothetical protein [Nitrososphaerales archaeon]